MSATNAPFGLRPAFHPSGLDRAQALTGGIVSGYGSNILKGQPVRYVTGGVIEPAAAGQAFVGGSTRRKCASWTSHPTQIMHGAMHSSLFAPTSVSTSLLLLLVQLSKGGSESWQLQCAVPTFVVLSNPF